MTESLNLVIVVAFLQRNNKENYSKSEQSEAAERMVFDEYKSEQAIRFAADSRVFEQRLRHPRFAYHKEVVRAKEVPFDPTSFDLNHALFVFAGLQTHHLMEGEDHHEHADNGCVQESEFNCTNKSEKHTHAVKENCSFIVKHFFSSFFRILLFNCQIFGGVEGGHNI